MMKEFFKDYFFLKGLIIFLRNFSSLGAGTDDG